MAKPTQLWPGERMRTFFRSIFRGESGVSDELADRLADICERHINRMLVWNGEPAAKNAPAPEAVSEATTDATAEPAPQVTARSAAAKPRKATATPQPQQTPTEPAPDAAPDPSPGSAPKSPSNGAPDTIEDVTITEAGAPWSTDLLDDASDNEPQDHHGAPIIPDPVTFDPFAFSVVVVLARSGAKALKAKLNEIESADHLRELADAQHLGVEARVREAGKLRTAIVKGAKQRLADRRAAAS